MWAMTSFEMWCFFGNMKGCLTSQGRFDISSLPPLRKIPLLSTNGDNLYSSLLLETLPPPLKVVTSSEKRSVWVSGTQYHSVLLISSGSRTLFSLSFCLPLVSWRFWCLTFVLLERNLKIQAVTPNNWRQEENLWMSNKSRDCLNWNVRLIFASFCLPSSLQSLKKSRPSEGQDFSPHM